MICLCVDERNINIDIVLLLTAPLMCCCSSLLKGFSLFNYIKCSNTKETQIWQLASCGSSVFTAASQLITLGEKKKKKQMCESSIFDNNSKKESVSIWLQSFRDKTIQRHKWAMLGLYAEMINDLFSGMCRDDLALLQWLFSHHVVWAVPYGHPGVTVVAHHDLVWGHPVTPANHIRDTGNGRMKGNTQASFNANEVLSWLWGSSRSHHVMSEEKGAQTFHGRLFCCLMLLF